MKHWDILWSMLCNGVSLQNEKHETDNMDCFGEFFMIWFPDKTCYEIGYYNEIEDDDDWAQAECQMIKYVFDKTDYDDDNWMKNVDPKLIIDKINTHEKWQA